MEKKHVIPAMDLEREEMEGARRATGVSSLGEASAHQELRGVANPDSQGSRELQRERPIGCPSALERALCPHLTTWRRQAEQGTLEALSPRKRGPKVQTPHPLRKRMEALERDNQQLRHQLKQAETLMEVQKTISEILHLSSDPKGEKR